MNTRTPSHEITQKYVLVIRFIRACFAGLGYSPSIREIGQQAGWSSSSTTSVHLHQLKEMGLVDWKKNQPRTLHTTNLADKFLAAHDTKTLTNGK